MPQKGPTFCTIEWVRCVGVEVAEWPAKDPQAWAATSRKARDALRRASLDVVHALEARILREVGWGRCPAAQARLADRIVSALPACQLPAVSRMLLLLW